MGSMVNNSGPRDREADLAFWRQGAGDPPQECWRALGTAWRYRTTYGIVSTGAVESHGLCQCLWLRLRLDISQGSDLF